MNEYGAVNSLSPFNMELLMTSIANNDKLVRIHQQKCAETVQLQQSLDSITETAQQVEQMYTVEKDRKDQLQAENAELNAKLERVERRLQEVENEQINNDTLNKQTIAQLEERLERRNKKYLDLCELFVEQGNILHTNGLTTGPLQRKCTAIKDILQNNGIHFEWTKSPTKQKSKSTTEKMKSKGIQTVATQADPINSNAVPKKITCDKSTQYQQSKTTRSTCTSAFIHKIDMSTSTDECFDSTDNNVDAFVDSILVNMASVPDYLSPLDESPIHDETSAGMASNSTQTIGPIYRTQGTLTAINNVRKRVNYVRGRTKSSSFYEVKKEECSSPVPSISNNFPVSAASQNDPIHLTAQFHHIWNLLGDLLYRIAGQGNMLTDEKWSNNMQIVQKLHEIQNLIDGKADEINAMKNIDFQDEHSHDSMESYSSGKIFVSKIRNLSNCSPMLDENPINSINEARPTFKPITFKPITSEDSIVNKPQTTQANALPSILPENDTCANNAEDNRSEQIQREKPCMLSNRAPNAHRSDQVSPFRADSPCSSNSPSTSASQTEDEPQFKVPKRRSSTFESDSTAKKRKITKKKTEKQQEMLTSLFGDVSDDDDEVIDDVQIQRILNMLTIPKMLSPIKDWPADTRTDSPSPTELNANEFTIPAPKTNVQPSSPQPEQIHDIPDTPETSSALETGTPPECILRQCDPEEIQIDQPLDSIESSAIPNTTTNTENSDKMQFNFDQSECVNEVAEMDYDSPASPKPEDQQSIEMPPTIPTKTMLSQSIRDEDVCDQSQVITASAIDQIIYNYVPSIRHQIAPYKLQVNDAECYLIANLRNAIERYCAAKEWTTATVTETIDKLLTLSRQPKHLATSILEVVEDTKESLSMEFTPPAPALRPSHQKCLVLVSRLRQQITNFDKYLQFELDRKLFTFHQREKSIEAMTNLGQFYVALIDIEQPNDRSKVRLFIYKCLYYFKATTVPLVFSVIMAHPYALPHANAIELISDPLIRAIVSTLSNIIYTDSSIKDKQYKKSQMFHTLKRRYGFFMDKLFPIDSVVDYCMECIRANRLTHVDYALILIAKRKDVEYSERILKKHLIPMLQQYLNVNEKTDENDEKICTILFTIGSIVKTFPIEQNIEPILRIFETCLTATQRQTIQEAAISAICQLNRFGTKQIYQYLANWKPTYTINSHIQAMLKTITYRKPKHFWFSNGNK